MFINGFDVFNGKEKSTFMGCAVRCIEEIVQSTLTST